MISQIITPNFTVIPKSVHIFPCLHLIFRSVLLHLSRWPSHILCIVVRLSCYNSSSVVWPDVLDNRLSARSTGGFVSYFLFHSLQYPYLWRPYYCSLSLYLSIQNTKGISCLHCLLTVSLSHCLHDTLRTLQLHTLPYCAKVLHSLYPLLLKIVSCFQSENASMQPKPQLMIFV